MEEEKDGAMKEKGAQWKTDFTGPQTMTTTLAPSGKHDWVFDHIFPSDSLQDDVYNHTAKRCIDDALAGFNATIFAYGQTGSGKTWTMFGNGDGENRGVIPRACAHIFDAIDADSDTTYSVRCSFVEIYKEKIRDLLTAGKDTLRIRQSVERGIYIQGVMEQYCSSKEEVLATISLGELSRTTSATKMNAKSSRSHSVFIMGIGQECPGGVSKYAKLVFIDLAGSEKVKKTGAEGNTLEEAKKINQSLTCLGNVIKAITEGNAFVPYRDSTLTRLLEESLQGNTKTTLFITCSPSCFNAEETISSLRFGARVKTIKTEVKINKTRSVEELEAELTELGTKLKAEKTTNARLLRLLEFLKSPQYNRKTGEIPPELLAPAKAPAKSKADQQATPPSASSTVKVPSSASSPSPTTRSRKQSLAPEDDPLELITAKTELQALTKNAKLDLQQLSCEVDAMKRAIEEHERETSAAMEAIQNAAGTKEREQKELKIIQAQIAEAKDNLSAERDQLIARAKELRAAIEAVTARNGQLQKKIAEFDDNLVALHTENEQLRKEAAEMARKSALQMQSAAQLEAEWAEASQWEARCQSELDKLNGDIAFLRSKGADTKAIAVSSDALGKRKSLKESVAVLEKESEQKQGALAAKQKELKDLRDAHRESLRAATALLTDLQAKLSEVLTVETSMFVAINGAAKSHGIGDLEKEALEGKGAMALKSEIEDRDSLLDGLTQELEAHEAAVDITKETWHEAQKGAVSAAALSEDEESKKGRIAVFVSRLALLDREKADAESQIAGLSAASGAATAKVKALRDKVAESEKALKAAQEQAMKAREQYKKYQQRDAGAQSEALKHSEELLEQRQVASVLKEKLDELQRQYTAMQMTGKALRSETTELKRALSDAQVLHADTKKATESAEVINKHLMEGKRVWRPPIANRPTLVDAFKDKVNFAAVASSLRPTLAGAFILGAAREEHEKSGSPLPSPSPPGSPAIGPTPDVCIANQKVTAADLKLYEKLFKMADKDGNGCIDIDELLWLIQTLGKTVTREEVEALVMDIDLDGNGTIEFMEFLRGMDRINEFFSVQPSIGGATATPSASASPSPASSPLSASLSPPPEGVPGMAL